MAALLPVTLVAVAPDAGGGAGLAGLDITLGRGLRARGLLQRVEESDVNFMSASLSAATIAFIASFSRCPLR